MSLSDLSEMTLSDQSQHVSHPLSCILSSTSSDLSLVFPLSSVLYSAGLSLGAAYCVYVPGIADRPDPFTKPFYPPSSFAPSLSNHH